MPFRFCGSNYWGESISGKKTFLSVKHAMLIKLNQVLINSSDFGTNVVSYQTLGF